MQFGFSAVQAGQKSSTVNAEPRLVVSSTPGKFTVTSPVSKALNVAVGENIQFLNNISEVEAMIANPTEEFAAWASENGLDLTSREGQEAALRELTVWAIAKGVLLYDAKNNPVMGNVRYSKEDKQKFIEANLAELVAANRDALIARNGGVDADDETLGALITPEDIEGEKYHVASGSKTATTGTATGVGCQLNFTDTSIWNTLKADLGDDDAKKSKNRNFKVCLDEAFVTTVSNGKEAVEVTAYPLEFVDDTDPIVREKK